MLQHLRIQNFALIEETDVDLSEGLTVITGETGAGKSILLGALGLTPVSYTHLDVYKRQLQGRQAPVF